MDLGSALAEFVDLLTMASNALLRLARDESVADPKIEPQLAEVEALARRLREIGDELRAEHQQER